MARAAVQPRQRKQHCNDLNRARGFLSLVDFKAASETKSAALSMSALSLQLFSYFMVIQIGIKVDQPRNLAKALLTE